MSGFLWIGLSGVAFVLLGLVRPRVELRLPRVWGVPTGPAPGRNFWSGAVLAAMLNAAGLVIWAQAGDPNLAWFLYGSSLATLLIVGWLVVGRPRPLLSRPTGEVWVVLALLSLATGLRLYDLVEQPFGFHFDEALNGLVTRRIVNSPAYRPVFEPETSLPALYSYVSLPFALVAGVTPLALRLTSVLGGVLGVLATYLLARELGSRRYAFVAGFLLAVMVWQLNFSRIAVNWIWSAGLDALAALFFVRALRRGGVLDGVLSGVCLGLGLQMYYISRMVPLLLGLYLTYHLVIYGRACLQKLWAPLLSFLTATVLTVSPLVLYAVLYPAQFWYRTSQIAVLKIPPQADTLELVGSNAAKYLLIFNAVGDSNGRHGLPGAPMLDPITGALFLVGLLYCVPRLRRPGAFLVVAWVPTMLIGGIFSDSAPNTLRCLDEVTAVALLAALPVTSLWSRWRELLVPVSSRLAEGLTTTTIVLFLAWISSFNVERYFSQMRHDYDVMAAYSAAETITARVATSLPSGTQLLLDRPYFEDLQTVPRGPSSPPSERQIHSEGKIFIESPTIRFLAPDLPEPRRFVFDEQVPFRGPNPVAVFLSPGADAAALQRRYPQSTTTEWRAPKDPRVLLSLVQIPAEAVRTATLPTGRYLSSSGTTVERVEAAFDQDWSSGMPVPTPFQLEWRAVLRVPTYERYSWSIEGLVDGRVELDDVPVAADRRTSGQLLAKGDHSLRVSGDVLSANRVRLLWRRPETDWSVVPPQVLFSPTVPIEGLQANYFQNRSFDGQPVLSQIEQTPSHFAAETGAQMTSRPYSVEYVGKLLVAESGTYRFGTQSTDETWFELDGRRLIDRSGERISSSEEAVWLDSGVYKLRVRFVVRSSRSRLQVYWARPGGDPEPLRSDVLRPP